MSTRDGTPAVKAGTALERDARGAVRGTSPLVAEARRGRRRGLFLRVIQNRMALFWSIALTILVLAAIFAPLVAPHDPLEQSAALLEAPSRTYLFGTDELGRDVLSRIIYGGRISLTVGLIAVAIAASFGTLLGLMAGFMGGFLDSTLMRIIDIMLAFPGIILAILIMGTLGSSIVNVMIAVGIGAIPWYARTVRGSTLVIKQYDFVLAARAGGASTSRLMLRHVLPNVLAPVIVLGTVGIAGAILAISSLSFLGLGAQPPSPEWGSMLSQSRIYITRAWWITTFPGLAIMVSVLAINIIGDALRDALDPRLRGAIKE